MRPGSGDEIAECEARIVALLDELARLQGAHARGSAAMRGWIESEATAMAADLTRAEGRLAELKAGARGGDPTAGYRFDPAIPRATPE